MDIIDTIDALIDEQLAEGEKQSGNDRCPHCDRDWHGFPLTEQIADMYSFGLFDEDYVGLGADDSLVLCPGSSHYGPARPEALRRPTKIDSFYLDIIMGRRSDYVMYFSAE